MEANSPSYQLAVRKALLYSRSYGKLSESQQRAIEDTIAHACSDIPKFTLTSGKRPATDHLRTIAQSPLDAIQRRLADNMDISGLVEAVKRIAPVSTQGVRAMVLRSVAIICAVNDLGLSDEQQIERFIKGPKRNANIAWTEGRTLSTKSIAPPTQRKVTLRRSW